jgi:hypothetical protein
VPKPTAAPLKAPAKPDEEAVKSNASEVQHPKHPMAKKPHHVPKDVTSHHAKTIQPPPQKPPLEMPADETAPAPVVHVDTEPEEPATPAPNPVTPSPTPVAPEPRIPQIKVEDEDIEEDTISIDQDGKLTFNDKPKD